MTACVPWPALVLTAGYGTRFRPLSYARAKPAVPVAGLPLICRILGWLSASGLTDAVLNLHYKPETITAVVGDGTALGLRVRYSWEDPILGSGGGPRKALPLLGAPRFLIVNGDTLCRIDVAAMLRQHEAKGALVTMALVPNPDPSRYGGVVVDDEGHVLGFSRTGREGNPGLHFVGIQIAEADVFADLPENQPAETIRGIYPALIAHAPSAVQAFIADAAFHDLGTPADYLATSLAAAREEGHTDLSPGARAQIDPSARLVRTAVWDDVTIEAGCRLTDCVVADGVRLQAGTELHGCAIVKADGRAAAAGESILGDLLIANLDTGSPARKEPRR
jgi:mannose-1-phosphate guanylyltransferase